MSGRMGRSLSRGFLSIDFLVLSFVGGTRGWG